MRVPNVWALLIPEWLLRCETAGHERAKAPYEAVHPRHEMKCPARASALRYLPLGLSSLSPASDFSRNYGRATASPRFTKPR